MTTLYGIPNCDTVKKARKWLEKAGIDHQFHDFRKDGLSREDVATWLKQLGADLLVNKRSTTWKQLSDAEKTTALEGDTAKILQSYPTLVKRPVLEHNGQYSVGFKPEQFEKLFT